MNPSSCPPTTVTAHSIEENEGDDKSEQRGCCAGGGQLQVCCARQPPSTARPLPCPPAPAPPPRAPPHPTLTRQYGLLSHRAVALRAADARCCTAPGDQLVDEAAWGARGTSGWCVSNRNGVLHLPLLQTSRCGPPAHALQDRPAFRRLPAAGAPDEPPSLAASTTHPPRISFRTAMRSSRLAAAHAALFADSFSMAASSSA